MKKVVYLLLVCVTAGAQTQGVPTGVRVSPSPDVPAIVNDRFRQVYPNASSTWKTTGDRNFEATFTDDSTHQPVQVLYSSTGEVIRKRGKLDKGGYPQMIDQYYFTNYPMIGYSVWREDRRDSDTLFLGLQGTDTLWFGKGGNYLHDRNKQKGRTLLAEKDRAYLVDISLANVERISMLSHVSDSSKVVSKQVMAGHYSQIDQLIRRFGATKNIPLAEPMLPVGKIREPSAKDFNRMDKRLLKTLQKTKKKARDKDLKELAQHIISLESRYPGQGESAR